VKEHNELKKSVGERRKRAGETTVKLVATPVKLEAKRTCRLALEKQPRNFHGVRAVMYGVSVNWKSVGA
jgi:hypothetical protein